MGLAIKIWHFKIGKVDKVFEEQAFEKHGFKKYKDSTKKIVVFVNDVKYQFDYETNKIFEIPSERIKFAVCIYRREKILFINKNFIPLNDTTSPYRTFYDGLMKEPFKLSYPFEEQVIIEVKRGYRLRFDVV